MYTALFLNKRSYEGDVAFQHHANPFDQGLLKLLMWSFSHNKSSKKKKESRCKKGRDALGRIFLKSYSKCSFAVDRYRPNTI